MKDNMPMEIFAGRSRNDKIIAFEAASSGEAQYHHNDKYQALLDEIKHKDAVIEVMRETLEEARCQLTDRADCRQEDSIFADRRNEGH